MKEGLGIGGGEDVVKCRWEDNNLYFLSGVQHPLSPLCISSTTRYTTPLNLNNYEYSPVVNLLDIYFYQNFTTR